MSAGASVEPMATRVPSCNPNTLVSLARRSSYGFTSENDPDIFKPTLTSYWGAAFADPDISFVKEPFFLERKIIMCYQQQNFPPFSDLKRYQSHRISFHHRCPLRRCLREPSSLVQTSSHPTPHLWKGFLSTTIQSKCFWVQPMPNFMPSPYITAQTTIRETGYQW